MARASDGTNVPVSPAPASSSNLGSPGGSLLDPRKDWISRQYDGGEIQRNLLTFTALHTERGLDRKLRPTLAQTVADQTTKIAHIEQIVV